MMAAAATMFAACTQTDFVNEVPETKQAIGFDTYSNKVARAENLEKAHDDFGVWAYMGATEIMTNYKVEYQDSKWVYGGVTANSITQPLRYWNKNETYRFYAYTPYTEGATIAANGSISIPEGTYAGAENTQTTFAMEPTDAAFTSDTDWMIATAQEDISGSAGATVVESFNHIMSKLDVVVTTSGTEKVNVNSISIKGLTRKGGYNGTAWTVDNGVTGTIAGTVEPTTDVVTGKEYYTIQCLLVPTAAATLTLDINYTISGVTYNYTDIPVTALTEFVKGTRYKLTASIGLLPIEFDAEYTAWTEGAGAGVTIQ